MDASPSAPGACPLAGRHVVITRPPRDEQEDDDVLPVRLTQWGARISRIPLIDVRPVPWRLGSPGPWDWIFFTSQNAVHAFYGALAPGQESLSGAKIAVVGPVTGAALTKYGKHADFTAPRFDAESAAQAFCQSYACLDLRVLWPCGNLANPQLAEVLSGAGAAVTPVVVYETATRTHLSAEEAVLLDSGVDMVVFASPSAVSAFHQACQTLSLDWQTMAVACLGPKTAEAARSLLGRMDVQPDMATMTCLAETIRAFYEEEAAR